ncbi:MAG TPA: hypothetical protein VLS48_02520, partial [Anaerolineales bacterium]|nr:hypothetical protein [Anaerolineales bacterium]
MNLELDGHQVKISSPEKLLFPAAGITKADMVDYYVRIAPVMLPHLAGRPISMQRFPNSIGESGFYQKEAADYFPDWITTAAVEVKEEGVSQPQVVVDSAAALAYLANLGVITLHTWLSRVGHLEKPDK